MSSLTQTEIKKDEYEGLAKKPKRDFTERINKVVSNLRKTLSYTKRIE